MFAYPPYGALIKCSWSDTDERKVEREMERAISFLKTPTGEKESLIVSEQVIPLIPKVRGKYTRFIVIRVRGLLIPESLRHNLAKLASLGFTIDRNPLSLS